MANSPCISSQVAILLCTYNGERYLKEQLDSVLRQTYSDWIIYASDDGSTDSTLRILQSYKDRLGARLVIFRGPGQGFSANFLSLVNSSDVAAAYYAFCDQDDVWHPDKLERGIGQLQALGEGVASLYCSRTRLVSSDGQEIGFSPCFERPASFRNALVQSLAGANTMVFNDLARGIIRKVPPATRVVSHDWLAYLLISGVGGGYSMIGRQKLTIVSMAAT